MYEDVFLPMLQRLAKRTPPISTIVDVGASDGRWSEMARKVWPEAALILLEPNPVHFPGMRERLARIGGVAAHMPFLVGGVEGSERVRFNDSDPFQAADPDAAGIEVPRCTIDMETLAFGLENAAFRPPYLIKLDCHGREHEILAGARETLKHTAALVVEVYTRSLGIGSLEMADLLPVIKGMGFAPSDLCDPMIRPCDGRCSQLDMLFERIDAPGMDSGGYG
jgi:FkbM family methyltransferase